MRDNYVKRAVRLEGLLYDESVLGVWFGGGDVGLRVLVLVHSVQLDCVGGARVRYHSWDKVSRMTM